MLLCAIVFTLCAAIPQSHPSSAINDYAGMIAPETRMSLESLASALYSRTHVAIVLVTVTGLDGAAIEDEATKLYNSWGIGQKGKDEGVLILLALKERQIRIEAGYGAESYIPDVVASRIIREASGKYLSENRWSEGLSYIMVSLVNRIAAHYGIDPQELQKSAGTSFNYNEAKGNPLITLLLIAFLLFFLLGTPFGRALLPILIFSAMSGRHGGGFGGGSWGGGSSGGFGGFGGGRSGGGGATGRF
jgi:uncharacterized protein